MSEGLRERILAWLADEGFEVRGVPAPPQQGPVPPPEWVLLVRAKAPMAANVTVQRPRVPPGRVAVIMGVKVSEEHRARLAKLNAPERAKLVGGLLRDLLLLCPDCLVVAQPNPLQPEGFLVVREIMDEEINRPNLVRTVRLVVNAFYLIVVTLNSNLGPYTVQGGPSPPTSYM